MEERVYFILELQRESPSWWVVHGSRRPELEAERSQPNRKQKTERKASGEDFKLLELTSTDIFPPAEVHNLPKQHHQLETKYSNTQAYGGIGTQTTTV